MSAPTVCAVMLANGRPEMAARAKACWHNQNYAGEKRILIYNNNGDRSIGALRNAANAQTDAEILIHWDSDDWSHPNRVADQVALLQSSGAECVGYNEMLFWKVSQSVDASFAENHQYGVAWLYCASVPNYAIGTSMCYWRSTWDRNLFPDRSEGCDDLEWFNRGVKIASVNSVQIQPDTILEPSARMIASIHGGNTCSKIDATKREWTRVPEWDAYCREAMKL